MNQIIPTIIASNYQELAEKVKKVEKYIDWVQLDIMDGQFVNNLTWPYKEGNLTELKNLNTKLKLEAHLMIENPENIISEWMQTKVNRIIFHYESTQQSRKIVKQIKQAGLEVGLAINPETKIEIIDFLIPELDLILIMTVNPGKGGQQMIPQTLKKIRSLRKKYPGVKIEVDGGINLQTAPQIIQAGANFLASGSAIFKSQNIGQTIKQMQNI